MSRWQAIRIPIRLVDGIYGIDNRDNAGDDLVNALRQVSEQPDQYQYRFAFDTAHPSHWYHALVFEVKALPDAVIVRLIELLTERGLVPENSHKH